MSAYRIYLLYGLASSVFVGVIDPLIAVYYVRVVGLAPIQLVLLGTIVEVAGLLLEVPTGVVADTYSRKLSVVLGAFCIGACFVVQGLVPLLPAIVAAEAVRGLGGTFISGALEAWIADEIGVQLATRAYMRYAQVHQVGALVGTGIGVALATITLGLPIVLGGAAMVALAVFLLVFMPEHGFQGEGWRGRETWKATFGTARAGARLVIGQPLLVTFLGVWAALALSTEGIDRLWEAHLLNDVGLPTFGGLDPVIWFGVVNAAFILLSVGGTELTRRWLDPTNHRLVAFVLLGFSVVRIGAVVAFGLATSFALAVVAYTCAEALRRMTSPVFTGWVNRHLEPRSRATVLSMGGQVDAVGQLAGGPLIGLVATVASLPAAMVAAGLVLVPVLPLLVRAAGQQPGLPDPAEVVEGPG